MSSIVGMSGGGTFESELSRSAEMLVEIAERDGVYFAIAFIHDLGYTHEDLKKLLPILQNTRGAIKSKENQQ